MVHVILQGCNGKMGQTITRLAADDAEMEIVAGIDIASGAENSYPVYPDLAGCPIEADVLIDFSSPKVTDALLQACAEKSLPCVLCTTGLSADQIQLVAETSKNVAMLRSANMSLGINLLLQLLQEAAPILAGAGFDMEIIEKHHNLKVDAPSGTAIALADAMNDSLGQQYEYVYDRSGRREKRNPKEIGISAVRGGTIVGDHDVLFAGEDEVITFSHRAYSKAVFGKGAIEAAKFLAGRAPGLYDMQDVIRWQRGQ